MKAPHLTQKIFSREAWAWLVLTVAMVLFGMTLTYAQEPATKSEGMIRIKIEKEENGKKLKLDTTFDIKDYDKMQETIRGFDEDFDMPAPPDVPMPPGINENGTSFSLHTFPGREEFPEHLTEEMKILKDHLKDLEMELKEMKIEMFSDSNIKLFGPHGWGMDSDSGAFFDFKNGAWGGKGSGCCIRIRAHADGHGDDAGAETESPGDADRVVIIKKNHRKSAEVSKDAGERKSAPTASSGKLEAANLEYYPNPGDGKFTLSFRLETMGNTAISITDPAGNEIYYETLKDFSGLYSRQIDIRSHGKGTYLVRLTQNNKSITKKLVVD
jgi:hypothetical protein